MKNEELFFLFVRKHRSGSVSARSAERQTLVNVKEKTMRKIILTSFVLAVLSMTCMPFASAQTGSYPYEDKPDATGKARTLLHQLSMVEGFLPPENDKIDYDIPNELNHSSNYIFVRPLLREIYLEGKDALPALVEFFDHENYLYHYGGIYSMAAGQIINRYVSIEAKNIFREIINPVAYDLCYGPKIVTRIGADGREHRAPVFDTPITEIRESAQQWLRQNADKSLADIQREIVDFYICEEIKIGFPDEESYQKYLVPLLNLRDNLPYVNENFHNVTVEVPYSSPPPSGSNPGPKNRPVRVQVLREPSHY